ncbi:hypothetical protein PISMIDRAFT_502291 [Pisolithus microcarpus 441]|uniref:Uncharacterized protein n=1 Tax=Pisolithus microcarpus 441 TaxID=765257 RepID=A0A0C9Z909_9AGAM|nr:hypothetical protein PISMIDRAFT_502291 [Pisolithus microcarpus 441]
MNEARRKNPKLQCGVPLGNQPSCNLTHRSERSCRSGSLRATGWCRFVSNIRPGLYTSVTAQRHVHPQIQRTCTAAEIPAVLLS